MTVDNSPMVGHSDFLRTPEDVCKPDSRNAAVFRPRAIEEQHREVAEIKLHHDVPEDVRIQFETTKNLYLYSWFVYRFYSVAKLHAYTCLELALRDRFEALMVDPINKMSKAKPGMKRLLGFAVDNGFLKNENFEEWQHRTEMRAKQRVKNAAINEMDRLGLNEVVIDESQYEINDEDRDHDYLATLLETMPWLRNHYAHGSTSLDSQALGTIKLVAEIINQIFLNPESVK